MLFIVTTSWLVLLAWCGITEDLFQASVFSSPNGISITYPIRLVWTLKSKNYSLSSIDQGTQQVPREVQWPILHGKLTSDSSHNLACQGFAWDLRSCPMNSVPITVLQGAVCFSAILKWKSIRDDLWLWFYVTANEITGPVIGECFANRHGKYSWDRVSAALWWPVMQCECARSRTWERRDAP